MTLQGKQHNLGVTDPNAEAAAVEALKRLLARELASPASGPSCEQLTNSHKVVDAVSTYLADLKARADRGKVTPGHYRNTRIILEQFARAFADVRVSLLRADQIEKWVETRPWSLSYQNGAIGAIGALLKAEGVALRLRKPPKESRGADTCLTEEQFDALIQDLTGPLPRGGRKRGDLAELLRLLRETGARPGELCELTVEGLDWPNCLIRLAKHKTRRHTGKDRVIHFNTAAMRILEAQRAKYGRGVLFRTRNGNPYKSTELWEVLGKASKRLGFRVVAYGQRHSFATNALSAGVPDAIVAELLGQKGTNMVHTHYAHLGQRAAALKQAAEMASRRTTGAAQ